MPGPIVVLSHFEYLGLPRICEDTQNIRYCTVLRSQKYQQTFFTPTRISIIVRTHSLLVNSKRILHA